MGPPLDVIFCRNVLIYFDKEFQRELLLRLIARLAPGGTSSSGTPRASTAWGCR